jgi:hypothetical protein
MTKPLTTSNTDGLSSPARRRMLAGCAGLAVTASFAPWIMWSAPVGGPQGDLFAFTAPTKRDLVFALALSPRPFGQTERDPLTVRLHAGSSSWMVGPFALRGTQDVLPDGTCLFAGQVWRTASNGVGEIAHLVAVATLAEHMPPGSLGVWAEILGRGGVRWRIGNPVVSHLLADDARLARVHATLHPAMDVPVLSAAIARRIAARPTGRSGLDSQAHAKRLAALILPDTLRFDPARPSGYTFAALNGRRAEDVIEPVVQTVLVGAPRPGRGARCYRATSQFPYFAKAA